MNVKFYVITLERSPERKRSVIKSFRKAGIKNYEFVHGLDAFKYTTNQLHRFLDKDNLVKHLGNGMIGCCVGHVKAVRRFVCDGAAEYGVVMEDDFIINTDLNAILQNIGDSTLNEGPVLLYGYVKMPVVFKKVLQIDSRHDLYEVQQPLHIWSTLGYLLNKKTAKSLLRAQYPIKDVADSWSLFCENGGFQKLFVVYPFAIAHEVFDSSRVQRKQAVADWIIEKRIPLLYGLIKKRRQQFVESDVSLIDFQQA